MAAYEQDVANSSGMVGQYLMDHPYYVAWGQLPMNGDQLWPYRGPLITSGIGDLCDGEFREEAGRHSASTSATRAGTLSLQAFVGR